MRLYHLHYFNFQLPGMLLYDHTWCECCVKVIVLERLNFWILVPIGDVKKIVGLQFLLSDLNLMYERKFFLNSYVSIVYNL